MDLYLYLLVLCALLSAVLVRPMICCRRVQPKVNHNEWRLLYFISFLLLVAFFVLNMFVGVVVENFHKCRESQEHEEDKRISTPECSVRRL